MAAVSKVNGQKAEQDKALLLRQNRPRSRFARPGLQRFPFPSFDTTQLFIESE